MTIHHLHNLHDKSESVAVPLLSEAVNLEGKEEQIAPLYRLDTSNLKFSGDISILNLHVHTSFLRCDWINPLFFIPRKKIISLIQVTPNNRKADLPTYPPLEK